jgi:sphingomyelin phosphodiesterase 2
MHRYPLNGRPTAFFRGDFYVGKGVACAAIRHPAGRVVEVFNTHLHAPYEKDDSYLCHRTAQAWEISKLIRGAVERGNIAIAAGDFNMIPSSLAHRIISTYGLVSDSWLSKYPDTPAMQPTDSTAKYNIEVLGATCDSVVNTWRMPGPTRPPDSTVDPHAQRLDYIFHSAHNSSIAEIKVGMIEPMPMPSQTGGKGGAGKECTLSDHFSVELKLRLAPSVQQTTAMIRVRSTSISHASLVEITGEARAQEAEIVDQVGVKDERYIPASILSDIMAVEKEYFQKEEKEYFWRIFHFWASIPVLLGTHVAVWWSPHNGVSFALLLVAWVVAVTGTLDGLIGFIFTGAELNALREFEEEINMYRELAEEKRAMRVGPGFEAGQ